MKVLAYSFQVLDLPEEAGLPAYVSWNGYIYQRDDSIVEDNDCGPVYYRLEKQPKDSSIYKVPGLN